MWSKLPCNKGDIQLVFSLTGGQCFRWKNTGEGEWTGVFAHRIWTLCQNDDSILYKVVSGPSNQVLPIKLPQKPVNSTKQKMKKTKLTAVTTFTSTPMSQLKDSNICEDVNEQNEVLLKQYFRLNINLQSYYDIWSKNDPHFKDAAVKFCGVRILDQDPTENLFSFICSSNNNISRISSMVEKLCNLYGSPIAEVGGITYHDFPPIEALADPSVEQSLRAAGFGYRAKFICQSACKIMQEGGSDWLHRLKGLPYIESKTQLMKLPGIGAKVADCICLMSLGHLEAIPVDTHIFQVAASRYLPHLKACKSVTDRVYNEIGDHFRQLYGSYAGWAHTIIFCADLKMFQDKSVKRTPKQLIVNEENKSKRKKATK